MATPRPRPEWSKEVKKFWTETNKTWEFDIDGIAILRGACDRLDRFYQCRDALASEGLTFKTGSGQIKRHPLLQCEKDAWSGFLQALKQLDLAPDVPTRGPGRPGSMGLR